MDKQRCRTNLYEVDEARPKHWVTLLLDLCFFVELGFRRMDEAKTTVAHQRTFNRTAAAELCPEQQSGFNRKGPAHLVRIDGWMA